MLTNDMRLVKAARKGDPKAFTNLVRAHSPALRILALRLIRDPEDACEVVQESLLKAFVHLHQFQGEARFSTWLTRIALNEAFMRIRCRPPGTALSLDDPVSTVSNQQFATQLEDGEPGPEGLCLRAELRRTLFRAIDSLAPRYRMVFVLRHVEEFSTRETAEILGLSVTAAKTRLRRARAELRRRLHAFYVSGWRICPPVKDRPPCQPRSRSRVRDSLPMTEEIFAEHRI
jgi:RNA polymerase sigma-70 factor, ECF subfamily